MLVHQHGDLLSVGHVSGRGDGSVVEVLELVHPHLSCSPCVPEEDQGGDSGRGRKKPGNSREGRRSGDQ